GLVGKNCSTKRAESARLGRKCPTPVMARHVMGIRTRMRFDVYIHGTFDPSAEARRSAAEAATSRLALSIQQMLALLSIERHVKVRSNIEEDFAYKIVVVLREIGIRAVMLPAHSPPPSDAQFQLRSTLAPVNDVTTAQIRSVIGPSLGDGEIDGALSS